MTLTFREAKLSQEDGTWLCIKVQERSPAAQFVLSLKDRLYDCELREHREKRSLDANAYYWKLCGELAKAVGEKPEEIYRRHIRDLGNYEMLCIQEKALEEFSRRWVSGHLGRFTETRASKIDGCVAVLAYYGSSDFDRREMSRLIDNCIQDCKAVGIETLTPAELEAMKEEWGRA